ncbi:MAG: phosphoribosylformylglycinamidine synthase subunit PurQ [Firmicutes bacterium]|nr:phosphoribosylformylglycinamidine synthase subunit PurQ [Bacillota bacterium]
MNAEAVPTFGSQPGEKRPRAAVVLFPGTNCDRETYHALTRAGWQATRLWASEVDVGYDLYVLPGGFSYGDYLRPGAIAAHRPQLGPILRAAAEGAMVLGICNGFQILLEAGVLPGVLLPNEPVGFRCRAEQILPQNAQGPFGRALGKRPLSWPIAHAAGRFWAEDSELDTLWEHRRVLAVYADDPNGSVDRIAGICDPSGRIAGLMPHPERAADRRLGNVDGLFFFQRLREEVAGHV